MPYVDIDYSDGHWDIRVLTDAEANDQRARGLHPPLVEERILSAWFRYLDKTVVWNTFWRMLDNQCSEAINRAEQYEVVFTIPALEGECKRGPFTWNEAVSQRAALVGRCIDAKIRNVETGEEC
jgi:hypothetical protein